MPFASGCKKFLASRLIHKNQWGTKFALLCKEMSVFKLLNICEYQIIFQNIRWPIYLCFFLNISQSAVLRKPNVYKEIAVSQFINVYFDVKIKKKWIWIARYEQNNKCYILIRKKLYWVAILQKALGYEISLLFTFCSFQFIDPFAKKMRFCHIFICLIAPVSIAWMPLWYYSGALLMWSPILGCENLV